MSSPIDITIRFESRLHARQVASYSAGPASDQIYAALAALPPEEPTDFGTLVTYEVEPGVDGVAVYAPDPKILSDTIGWLAEGVGRVTWEWLTDRNVKVEDNR